MNKVFLIGRLTQDPTASSFESGHSYCRFSIAVNRPYSRDGENRADFINIITWDSLAQNCVKYLVKGSQVAVVGSIQTGSYERDVAPAPGQPAPRQGGQTIDTLTEVQADDNDMPF